MDPAKSIQKYIQEHDWKLEGNQLVSVATFLAGLATFGATGFLKGLVDQRQSDEFFKELKQTLPKIAKKIESKVSIDYLKSRECSDLIVDTIAEATKVRNRYKTNYFISALVSGIHDRNYDEGKNTMFLSCLSDLSLPALSVLAKIFIARQKMQFRGEHTNVGILRGMIGFKDRELFVSFLRELERFNLIYVSWASGKRTSDNGLLYIMDQFNEFCAYITDYAGDNIRRD